MLVAGVDSSTQSTKVLLCDAADGTVLGQGSAPHPEGTESDPEAWWSALGQAGDGLLERADAVGVAAQQHGLVALDDADRVVRPALLWNDVRSGPQAQRLVEEHGTTTWAAMAGSVPTASFTITKLAWLAEYEPDHARRVATVLLPHDWLTWRLARAAADRVTPTTDRGDASGTGYWSPAEEQYRPELVKSVLGHEPDLPRVAGPAEKVGEGSSGTALSAGTGDNMGAALGLGLQPGEVAVSVGTSGTAFAVAERPANDPTGAVAGFADATGRFLPLVCTLNAARVLDVTARLLAVDPAGLSELALRAEPGAGGLALLPYLDGERTPNRPTATGVLRGFTTASATRENLARAAVEAVLASLADAVDRLAEQGVHPSRVLLLGGGARSAALRILAPGVFGLPVAAPEPGEYVALGAARQAAWALAGTREPPDWPRPAAEEYTGEKQLAVRLAHAALRDDTEPWHS